MTLRFETWAEEFVATDEELTGYARQRATEVLQADETCRALWEAINHSDHCQSELYLADDDHDELVDSLRETRREVEETLDELAAFVVYDAIQQVDVWGYTVDLTQSTSVDCLSCEESVEAYYLTARDDEVGYVCGHCGCVLLDSGGDWSVADSGGFWSSEPVESPEVRD